jgi:glycosyltransferase involved in cell wall biosynthesis
MAEIKNSINVAFLLGSLNRGGTETLLADCFFHHKEAGFATIGVYRNKGTILNDFLNSGVQLFQLKPKNFFDLKYLLKLRKIFKTNKINIIHAQQPIDALYGYLATLGLNIKLVLSFHGFDFNYDKMGRAITKFIIRRTDLNIFVSEHQKEYYQKKYKLTKTKLLKRVYNGISFNKLDIQSSTPLAEELGLSQKQYLFGSVGNFVSVRDQYTICRFLYLLNKNNISFHFLFIGAKDDAEPWRYDQCKEYCSEKGLTETVHFLGTRSDVPSILKQLDAFIYSTDHDTFGIAVIEAMASGIPVFVNDWKVMLEISGNGKFAEIYKTKNEKDLLSKFENFLNDPGHYKQRAVTNSELVKEKFSIQKHLSALQSCYSSLLMNGK